MTGTALRDRSYRSGLRRRLVWSGAATLALFAACGARAQDPASPVTTAPPAQDSVQRGASTVQEVIVTANKRSENLLHVGSGISVVSSAQLDTLEANSLADYLQLVPGVALQSFGAAGYGSVEIRGISPQSVGATVSTYIDDIPVSSSSAVAEGGEFTPDLDPADLQRVEVLKGPQGTLYGASSLGGVIKYVTKQPSLTKTEGDFSQEVEGVDHGDAGGKVRASFSTPLTDDFAVRLSGYYRWIPGYVDDIGHNGDDTNNGTDWGLRATALWKPTNDLSFNLNYMTQEVKQNGYNTVDYDPATIQPLYGKYDELRYSQEYFKNRFNLLSLEVNYQTPYGTLLSASSYSSVKPSMASDDTLYLIGIGDVSTSNPGQAIGLHDDEQETEELRFTSKRLGNLEFISGLFLQHEFLSDGTKFQTLDSNGQTLDTSAPYLGYGLRKGQLSEAAGFINATYYILPRLDVTLGYRYSYTSQHRVSNDAGLVYEGDETTIEHIDERTDQGVSTYLAGARWRVTDDVMFYARAASGYRPGGIRTPLPEAPPNFAPFYTSDTIWSYETGVKAKSADDKLTLEADAFWIDWSNIQTLVYIGQFDTDGNGGHATSRGLEAQSTYIPIRGLTLTANGAWTDAFFNTTDAEVSVVEGQRLFFVPKLQGSLGADYSWPIGRFQADLGGSWSYTGSEYDITNHALPAYFLVDLHAGLKWQDYSVNAFVKNALNKRALVGDDGYYPPGEGLPFTVTINQPLTVGISFSEHF